MNPCPACNLPLDVWIDSQSFDLHARCENHQCVLSQRNVLGTGQSTQEAVNAFKWKAAKIDANFAIK